jgi:UDPglucose 6-dehydrogenase
MRLTTFGVGYVGLVTGTGLAEIGHQVLCLDVDAEKVARLERGEIPIYEPGLGDLVKRNERSGRLHFATTLSAPYDQSELYFIAVGTPPNPDGSADLRAVFAACETIAKTAQKGALVVVKSTVPVGTCDLVQARLEELAPGRFEVVSNPEFLKEGAALERRTPGDHGPALVRARQVRVEHDARDACILHE